MGWSVSVDVDSLVGDIDDILDWEPQKNEFDAYTPRTWKEMWDFDEKRAREMREAEKGYEVWLKDCKKGRTLRKWTSLVKMVILNE